MKEKLIEWYSSIISEVNTEYINKIEQLIIELTSEVRYAEVNDLVKIFYGISNKESEIANKIEEGYLKIDSNISIRKKKIEFQLIAASALYYIIFISEEEENFKLLTCLFVLSANFPSRSNKIVLQQLIFDVQNYLTELALARRNDQSKDENLLLEFDQTTSLSDFATTVTKINELTESLEEYSVTVRKNFKILREESNILWWLFSEFSNELECLLSSLNKESAALVIPKELFGLIKIYPGPPSVLGFIAKGLSNCKGDDKSNLGEIISSTSKTWREKISNNSNFSKLTETTPIFFSIYQSLQTDSETDWHSIILKQCHISATKKVDIATVAYQFFIELTLNALLGEYDFE